IGSLGFPKNAVIDGEERSAYDHEETYAKEAARQTGEAKQSLRRAQTVSDQHRSRQSRRGRELLLEIIGAERTHASRLALLFRLWLRHAAGRRRVIRTPAASGGKGVVFHGQQLGRSLRPRGGLELPHARRCTWCRWQCDQRAALGRAIVLRRRQMG